jgi:hypothetical protein
MKIDGVATEYPSFSAGARFSAAQWVGSAKCGQQLATTGEWRGDAAVVCKQPAMSRRKNDAHAE